MPAINLPTDVATLQAMLLKAYTDDVYGCSTRAGLMAGYTPTEGDAVLFLDIDGMGLMNKELGYPTVNANIKRALTTFQVRAESELRAGDLICARWFSGDEIVVIAQAQHINGLAARMVEHLSANGISATMAIAAMGSDLEASVTVASDKVQASKAKGVRGVVIA